MHYVYILFSVEAKRLYIGSTNNVERRLVEHNSGKVISTRAYRPYVLLAVENFSNKTAARKREVQIKKSGLLRRQFKQMCKNND